MKPHERLPTKHDRGKRRIITPKGVQNRKRHNDEQRRHPPMERMRGPKSDLHHQVPFLLAGQRLHRRSVYQKIDLLVDLFLLKNVTVLAPGYSPRTGLGPSTIAAGGLNGRVRDGNGCDPAATGTKTVTSFGCHDE